MIRHVEETMTVAGALAIAALLAGRWRGVGPAARHVFWLTVLIKLLTPPWIPAPWPTPASWLALDPPPRDDVAVAVGPAPSAVIKPAARSAQLVDRTAGAVPDEARRAHDLDASLSSNADVDQVPARSSPRVNRPEHDAPSRKTTSPPLDVWSRIPAIASLERVLLPTWLLATFALAALQCRRILRFRGRLRDARPAPAELVEAARAIAAQMRVRPPEMLVVTDLAVPSIWCLGRPRLLLPEAAVENLPLDAWRGVLAHELAHLKRGDHWVSRLELVAGLVWWWNPLFRLARRRIDAEAELACDAWVVSTLPDERLGYAAALLNICERLALAATPAPALGVTGSGRFMERRLNMILSERVPCRVSPVGLLAAGLMLIVALPSWSAAKWNGPAQVAANIPAAADPFATADDQDDKDAVTSKSKAKEKSKAKAAAAKDQADKDAYDAAAIEKAIKEKLAEALGPDFEKKMEKLGAEIEHTFGPGSDFEKKLEKIVEEVEQTFGPGSDFEKKIKEQFGPDSDFVKKLEALGPQIEAAFGSKSDFMNMLKKKIDEALAEGKSAASKPDRDDADKEARAEAKQARRAEKRAKVELKIEAARDRAKSSGRSKPAEKSKTSASNREARIKALEARIKELAAELKQLEAEEDNDNE